MKSAAERFAIPLLLLILLLALGLRLHHLGLFSLWQDEGFTRFFSANPVSYLWGQGARLETNPPLYYTVMHFWIRLFGTSETGLRSFSVIASLAAIVLVYLLGRELESRTVGLVGALLMALSPTEIWYAQEARTYAWLQVPLGLAFLGMARYLVRPGPASLACYAVGAITAVYCHDTALLFVLACNLAFFSVAFGRQPLVPGRALAGWIAANGAVALAVAPLVLLMLGQSGSNNIRWIPHLRPGLLLMFLGETIAGPALRSELPYPVMTFWSALLLFVLGYALWQFRPPRRFVTVLVLVPVLFLAVAVLVSLHRPILLARILSWFWIPLSLLLAHVGIRRSKSATLLRAIAVGVLVVGLMGQLFPLYSLKDNWREALAANRDSLTRADVVVIGEGTPLSMLAYYQPALASRVVLWPGDTPYPMGFGHAALIEKFNVPTLTTAALRDDIDSGKRVRVFAFLLDGFYFAPALSHLPPPTSQFVDNLPGVCGIRILNWGD